MDFKDKRFGGRDSDKDRTVPPDENYYANSGFDLNNYRPKGFYGKKKTNILLKTIIFSEIVMKNLIKTESFRRARNS